MGREIPLSLNERDFILQALSERKRLDEREFLQQRSIRIHLSTHSTGTVDVSLGSTRVLAKVTAEVQVPFSDRPTEGFLQFSTELTSVAVPNYEPGRLSEQEIFLSRTLEKTLRLSRAVDMESLCIVAGKKAWSIHVEISVLQNDGSLADCASVAAICALLHFRRPEVTVIGEEITVHPIDQRNPVPLSILHIPICTSFAFFGDGDQIVADPTKAEEQVSSGQMTVAINNHREVCSILKPGGVPLEMDVILSCCEVAHARAAGIIEQIQALLKEDQKKRESRQGGLMGRKER